MKAPYSAELELGLPMLYFVQLFTVSSADCGDMLYFVQQIRLICEWIARNVADFTTFSLQYRLSRLNLLHILQHSTSSATLGQHTHARTRILLRPRLRTKKPLTGTDPSVLPVQRLLKILD